MYEPQPHRRARRISHEWLFALPGGALPSQIECAGKSYRLVDTFKHDFFAATGLYALAGDGSDDRVVLKVNRINDFFGVPLRWVGRLLARRELLLYRAAKGIDGVPALIGAVGDTGVLHAYVPGRPLARRDMVADTFFDELLNLLRALHARHIAYVDLNKRQNILLGADGRPYLFDFQISLYLPPDGWRRWRPVRWLLRRFQKADYYHFLKHKRRLQPHRLTAAEEGELARLSPWIRLHRAWARPLTRVRRLLLRRLQAGVDTHVAGSSAK